MIYETTVRQLAKREGYALVRKNGSYGLLELARNIPIFGYSGFYPDAELAEVDAFLRNK